MTWMCLLCPRCAISGAAILTTRHSRAPTPMQILEYVWFLVVRLGMRVEDLVQAVMLFEACITPIGQRGLLGLNFVRRLFLSCCFLTLKVNSEVRPHPLKAVWCRTAFDSVRVAGRVASHCSSFGGACEGFSTRYSPPNWQPLRGRCYSYLAGTCLKMARRQRPTRKRCFVPLTRFAPLPSTTLDSAAPFLQQKITCSQATGLQVGVPPDLFV